MSIDVICFKWKNPQGRALFDHRHVDALYEMAHEHVSIPFTFHCVTDDSANLRKDINPVPLPQKLQSLIDSQDRKFAKLWLLSNELDFLQSRNIVYLDLDTVITGDFTNQIDWNSEFGILRKEKKKSLFKQLKRRLKGKDQRKGTYNSSFLHLAPGAREQVWLQFDREHAERQIARRRMVGTDQAWIQCVLGENEKTYSSKEGFYRFSDLERGQPSLPENAKLVYFTGGGHHKPWTDEMRERLPWITDYYPELP